MVKSENIRRVTDKILENNLLGKKPVKVNTLVKKSKEVERD